MNARHSKENPNWQTPPEWVQRAWQVLGKIADVDPFTTHEAPQTSLRRITPLEDGFTSSWGSGCAFVNHPGGTTKRAWKKLLEELGAGIDAAVWIGFSVEQLNILADAPLHPLDFSTVHLRKRIDFIDDATGKPGGRPGHGNYITAMGVSRASFDQIFGPFGKCTHGKLST